MMDQIYGWVKLQEEINASFDNATGIFRGLRDDNAKLCTERDLLRAKQHEETTALLKKTGVIVKKLMDKNAILRIECQRLVEESVAVAKQHIQDMKEIIAARSEN